MQTSDRGYGHDSTDVAALKCHTQELNDKKIMHASLTCQKVMIVIRKGGLLPQIHIDYYEKGGLLHRIHIDY